MQMVVLKKGFLSIFMFIPCSLILIIIVHDLLPTKMQDYCDDGSNYSIKILLEGYLVLLTCYTL